MASDSGLWSLGTKQRVHFVGVGGVRMSALAEMLARRGCTVTGSDREASAFTDRLRPFGVTVQIGHAAEHVGAADAVVFTPAVDPENPELVEARQKGIRIVEGKHLLGEMTRGKRLIAVSGTHGKTTTTAMITQICETAGMDPTSFVGGAVQGEESNLRVGADDVWVVEADEYDRAFLELSPTVAVVTSLEADHLDLYASQDEISETFEAFLSGMDEAGTAVLSNDYEASRELTVPEGRQGLTFGLTGSANLTVSNVTNEGLATTFTVKRDGVAMGEVTIGLPGKHNVSNALSAIGATLSVGADWNAIRDGLAAFRGVRRRFEVMGEVDGVMIVNDYAHHPTEITQTLMAARSVWDGRIVAVFQPHLYSRTRDFADGFIASLSGADVVCLTDVYPAREIPIPGISGRTIADGIEGSHYEANLDKLADSVRGVVRSGDMVLVMGAGSIERVANDLSGGPGEEESGRPFRPTPSQSL
jgi:UDP-N-acetylmuramate--alanine ligase